MDINNPTVKEERTELKEYYEKKYWKLIEKEYEKYYSSHKKRTRSGRRQFEERINYLYRERKRCLEQLDQATISQLEKLYQENISQ